ncbi:MAG: lytic transglycosylase domain-containing protein [Bacteroidales bacterium]
MLRIEDRKRGRAPKQWQRGGLVLLLLIIGGGLFSYFTPGEKEVVDTHERNFRRDYAIYSLSLPDTLYFAQERVPVEYFDVKEGLDQELLINTYWQSKTLLLIKRANRWFPLIEPILKEQGIPDDFKYLVLVESDLTNAVSPAGAVGIWQLLKGTARDYGLEVDKEVDERYHFEKSTKAACAYFHDAHELFGSWTMAAASYNMGRNGLLRQVNRQKERTYYDLLLNKETSRYLYRAIALKIILQQPERYGFHLRPADLYYPIPTYTVSVDTSVTSFADFAKEFGINYKILKYFNPWLRDSFLKNPHGKSYQIEIPKEGYRLDQTILSYHLSDTSLLRR